MGKVTQQQIADTLGISKFAVSRALADKTGVSEETRQSILAAAEKLGYRRTPARRAGQSPEILFAFQATDTPQGEFWVKILQGAQEEAQRMGVRTSLRLVSKPEDVEGLHDGIDGVVFSGPFDEDVIAMAARLNVPVVRTSPGPPLDQTDRVMVADFESGVAVARHLVELGHTRAVYAEGTPGLAGRAARYRGFSQNFPTPVRAVTFDEQAGIGPLIDGIYSAEHPPTAFFCASDGIAVNTISELSRRGLRVPDDVSVVGYLDYALATQIAPALTTVRVPIREMGITIMRCLLDRVFADEPASATARRIQLIPQFIVRESTGPAPPHVPAPRRMSAEPETPPDRDLAPVV